MSSIQTARGFKQCFTLLRLRNNQFNFIRLITNQSSSKKEFHTTFQESQEILSFNNPAIIAANRTKWEIMRALSILHICSKDFITNNCLTILTVSKKIFGTRLWKSFLRPTFFKQFVGGETIKDFKVCSKMLEQSSMLPLVFLCVEEPIHKVSNLSEMYLENTRRLISCVESISEVCPLTKRLMLLKITSLMPSEILEKLGKYWFDETNGDICKVPIKLIENMAKSIQKGTLVNDINFQDLNIANLEQGLVLLKQYIDATKQKQIHVAVDAEMTTINQGISIITLALMMLYNQNQSHIYNTYQCYLKNTEARYQSEFDFVRSKGLHFGAKLVRGAYLFWEKEYAKSQNLKNPIHDNYENTNLAYNKIMTKFIDSCAENSQFIKGIITTHNEDSISKAITRLEKVGIQKNGPIAFGQLYGMADNISMVLGQHGYTTYKAVSFGPIEECLPFLIRRIQENRVVFELRNEKNVLRAAYKLK